MLHEGDYNSKNDYFYERYKDGTLDIHEFLDFQLAPSRAARRRGLDAWHNEFMRRKIRPMILPKAPELIAKHADALTAIVTATNRFITRPIADELGVRDLIATDIEEMDGVFTGKPRGTPPSARARSSAWTSGSPRRAASSPTTELVLQRLAERPAAARARDHPIAVDPDETLRRARRNANGRSSRFADNPMIRKYIDKLFGAASA